MEPSIWLRYSLSIDYYGVITMLTKVYQEIPSKTARASIDCWSSIQAAELSKYRLRYNRCFK